MKLSIRRFTATGLACAMSFGWAATAPADPIAPTDFHAPLTRIKTLSGDQPRAVTRGGAVRLRWNHALLSEFGITQVQGLQTNAAPHEKGFDLALTTGSSFAIDGGGIVIDAIAGGGGQLAGGFRLSGRAGEFEWASPRFVVRPAEAIRIDFVGADGSVWFYADKLMYEFIDGGKNFRIRSADLRITGELAQRLGRPDAENALAAELRLLAPVSARSAATPKIGGDPNFHGDAVAGFPGAIYQADVFMQAFTAAYGGCLSCDGPGGASDGQVKFVPSSTLVNNRNPGTATATIPGDPLGTSTALHTADVSWYEKFTVSPWTYPYPGNDQHPYLIWNLYRLDANGGLTQVGRSGVKHAFLTINVGAGCDNSNGGHILGRSCSDTYGTGNNDNPSDLGPRREIIPATGQFGRCRSIFDTACDGSENAVSTGAFERRLLVRESDIASASNPGATWLFESWYIVQDDINIYNTMGTRPFSSAYTASGNSWSATNGTPFRLGPAIDRWVDPSAPGPLASNQELLADEGHAKVAVKVIDLGGGSFRYNFAVMNHDFSRAVTQGTSPNLEVLRNLGFNSFSIPVRADSLTDITFNDGDADPSNNWTFQVGNGRVEWRAPAGNELNWGTLFSFGFVASARPFTTTSRLGVAEAGIPAAYFVTALVPDSDVIFAHGYD